MSIRGRPVSRPWGLQWHYPRHKPSFPPPFNEKRHIISNFLPLITLVIGILNFVRLSKNVFQSLSCDIDLGRSSQRQIRYIECDIPFLHLLNQIVQKGLGYRSIVSRQRSTVTAMITPALMLIYGKEATTQIDEQRTLLFCIKVEQ